jgi:hypothetical protein
MPLCNIEVIRISKRGKVGITLSTKLCAGRKFTIELG